MKLIITTLILLFTQHLFAEIRIGIDSNVVQDSKDLSTSTNSNQTFYDGSMKVQLAWGGGLYLGIGYVQSTTTEPVSTTQQYTIASNYPYAGFSYFFGTDQLFSLEANWMPNITAEYTQSGTSGSEIWTGNGSYGKFTIQPKITPYLSVQLTIGYISANYTSKSATTAITTKTSFSRAITMPMIGFQFIF